LAQKVFEKPKNERGKKKEREREKKEEKKEEEAEAEKKNTRKGYGQKSDQALESTSKAHPQDIVRLVSPSLTLHYSQLLTSS
jgi:hypothetical protein